MQKIFWVFLKGRGYVGGEAVAMPAQSLLPLPLTATDVVVADRPGLLAYHVKLGDVVAAGDVLADLIILDGPTAFVERHLVRAGTDGFILSLRCLKYVWPGILSPRLLATNRWRIAPAIYWKCDLGKSAYLAWLVQSWHDRL